MWNTWEYDARDASLAFYFLDSTILPRRPRTPAPTPAATLAPSDSGSSSTTYDDDGYSSSDLYLSGYNSNSDATPPSTPSPSAYGDGSASSHSASSLAPVDDLSLAVSGDRSSSDATPRSTPSPSAYGDGSASSHSASSPAPLDDLPDPSLSVASGDGVDHISRLPDELLHDIVSRLTLKEAGRTVALSRRWVNLWPTTRIDLLEDSDIDRTSSNIAAVTRCVTAHRGTICAADIRNLSFSGYHQELRELILRLSERNVDDLVLVQRPLPFRLPLPPEILSFASLVRLHLGFWELPSPITAVPQFNILKELGLFHCIVPDSDMDVLLRHSPHLQILAVGMCREYPSRPHLASRTLRVSSPSLRIVTAWACSLEEIVVDGAPCLEKLLIHNSSGLMLNIVSSPLLRVLGFLDLSIHDVAICNTVIRNRMKIGACITIPTVKVLGIKINWEVHSEMSTLAVLLRCFPNVETLHIMSLEASNTNNSYPQFWQSQEAIDCVKFSLRTTVLHGFIGKENEFHFIRYLATEGMALQVLGIVCNKGTLEKQWASPGGPTGAVFVQSRTAHLSFRSMVDTSIWTQPPFFTMVIHGGQSQGLEVLPSILMEVDKVPHDPDSTIGRTEGNRIGIHHAGHTWSFQSATDLDVDDPFCELMDQIW